LLVFVKNSKKAKADKRTLIKTLSASYHQHTINNFKIIIITTERSYNTEKERE